ncbi:954_t:CDS:2, partial [Acaulospora colombiana]
QQQYIRLRGEKVRAVSSQEDIQIEVVRHNSSHIKGKHTVRLLPFASAKLNPDDERLCLQRSHKKKFIELPILFNKTYPASITYSRVDFETGTQTLHKFSSKDIERHRIVDVIQDGVYVYIPIDRPGAYRIEESSDNDGMGIKIYNRQEIIFYCPAAKLIPKSNLNLCFDDVISVDLVLEGVPPLSIQYERRVNDAAINMTIDGISSDYYASPPIQSDQAMVLAASGNYQWARDQVIHVPLNITADVVADYSLKVQQIQDILNNTRFYDDEESSDTMVDFSVYSRPTASFFTDSPVHVRPGRIANIAIDVRGRGPWKINVEYWSEESMDGRPSEMFEITIDHRSEQKKYMSVSRPGIYKLLSVSDSKCAGQIMAPSSKSLSIAHPPTVKMEANPIPAENCPGEIGVEITMSLTGIPPWHLEYKLVTRDGDERGFAKIDKSRHSLIIKPDKSGNYDYVFYRLSDYIYTEGVGIDHRFTQIVHPMPHAAFRGAKNQMLNSCIGSRVDLEVEFSGTGPFTLIYDVVFNRRTNAFTIADIQGPSHVITSPPFDNQGLYTVTLVKITDSKGCSKILSSSDYATINVKKDKPTAGFRSAHEIISFLEGKLAKLPLQLTGHAPWNITYRYIGDDKVRREQNLQNPNSYLIEEKPGFYELLEVKDSFCHGKIIPELKTIEARWLPRPFLRIAGGEAEPLPQKGYYRRRHVCEGAEDTVGLVLEGRAPWLIFYTIMMGDELISHQQNIGFPTTRIRLMTEKPGRYIYNFSSIADDVYTDPNPISLVLEQTVVAKPTAQFITSGVLYHCVGSDFTEPLEIKLSGVAPFVLQFEITHESSNQIDTMKIENIYDAHYRFYPLNKFSMIGRYVISMVYIMDSQGCNSVIQDKSNKLIVQVTDVASIERTFPLQIHCVGDLLDYSLQGIPPWNITYEYNGEIKYAISKQHTFTFGADKPGNMTITRICHQKNQCCGHANLTEIIYDLPTAIVSEGKDVISDIREGDKTEIVASHPSDSPIPGGSYWLAAKSVNRVGFWKPRQL